jgi:hypothetical protein
MNTRRQKNTPPKRAHSCQLVVHVLITFHGFQENVAFAVMQNRFDGPSPAYIVFTSADLLAVVVDD